MPKRSLADQLDQALEAMFAGRPLGEPRELAALVDIAKDLRGLPRPEFKERLKSELKGRKFMATPATESLPSATRQTATAHLRVKNAAAAIDFYKKAFAAKELIRIVGGGEIAHAEIEIGNTIVMIGEAAPDWGYPGPEGYGGSPMTLHLYVPDVDAFVARAFEAGAKIIGPVENQPWGERGGSVADPFGYTWGIATRKEAMPEEEQRRFEASQRPPSEKPAPPPRGFRTLTPYIIVQDAPGLIDFARITFGAEEKFRATGSAGGIHAEVRIGDTMLMIGGGGPGLAWRGESQPTALHTYVEDVDAAYERALKAGGVSSSPPVDQPYGERSAGVMDRFGNHWYIATYKGEKYVPEGLGTVTPYLHPLRAEPFISFLKRAFGADEVEKYASPDGVIQHAKVKIGDSFLEMGEAHGPYQPMPTTFFLYVPNVDTSYQRAITAGATSTGEPADQPYGDRMAGVKDAFGNQWYLATPIARKAE